MRSLPALAATSVLCGVMIVAVVPACAAEPECQGEVTALHEPAGSCLRFGVSTPGGPLQSPEIAAVAQLAGVPPTVILSFHDFTAIPPIAELNAVAATGADAIVTWEPWMSLGADIYDRGAFTMASIAAGVHDDHLYRWADELVAWGSVMYLRFAHEPNGTWYPWSPAGGTSPELYVEAWRHVHDLFRSKGASNVKWVWSPNVPVPDEGRPLTSWYPGDEYVDVIGIDGYNWGTSAPDQRWVSPRELFDPALTRLREFAPEKPILITEVASAEQGGSKSEWIGDLVEYLDREPGVSGFVWFDYDKETDWRINSSPEAGAALARALQQAGVS